MNVRELALFGSGGRSSRYSRRLSPTSGTFWRSFAHLACAAFFAISRRRSGVSLSSRAWTPFLIFFLLRMVQYISTKGLTGGAPLVGKGDGNSPSGPGRAAAGDLDFNLDVTASRAFFLHAHITGPTAAATT